MESTINSGVASLSTPPGTYPNKLMVTVPHNPDTDWHQWWFPNGWRGIGPTEERDRGGRARGGRNYFLPTWFVLACNNTDCDARAAVPVALVLDFANHRDPYTDVTYVAPEE